MQSVEPGSSFKLYRTQKDPSLFVYIEVYPSQVALEEHGKTTTPARAKELGPTPAGLLARPTLRCTRRPTAGFARFRPRVNSNVRASRKDDIVITIHHLGVSQSERIVWLMEELGLPYRLKWYDRKPNRAAPDEYLALHPTGDGARDRGRRPSAHRVRRDCRVRLSPLCERQDDRGPEQPNYYDYLYWMHFNNSAMGLASPSGAGGGRIRTGGRHDAGEVVNGAKSSYLQVPRQAARRVRPTSLGPELTCADIMVVYRLTTGVLFGARSIDDLPNASRLREAHRGAACVPESDADRRAESGRAIEVGRETSGFASIR